MSRKSLEEIVESQYSQLIKLKIGQLVRATLPDILEYGLISELEVVKLTKENYSKMIFDMNYPVLRQVNENLSIKDNRMIGEYPRYYADPCNYKGSRFLISSEWYDRNQEHYIKWLKRKVGS